MAKVLLGFMGAGKSTIARGLDPDYLDMDALIEKRLGMSITNFFAEKGEEAFRQVESEVLADLLQTDQVVSTGGGVVVSQRNRDLLKTNSDNIYLKADFETLYQRISADKNNQRPLFLNNSKEELAAIFQERQAWYEEVASRILDVTKRSPEEIIEELRGKLLTEVPRDHFHTTLCRQLFLMRNCRPLPILQMSSRPMSKDWWTILWCQLKILSRVVFMKPWTTFFIRLASKQWQKSFSLFISS